MDKTGCKASNDHGEKGGNILSHIDMLLATSQIAEMKKRGLERLFVIILKWKG